MSLSDKEINTYTEIEECESIFDGRDIKETIQKLKQFLNPKYRSNREVLDKIYELFGAELSKE